MVEYRHLCRSLANISLHRGDTKHFVLALTICEKLIFLIFDLENVGLKPKMYVNVTDEKNGIYAISSQMCIAEFVLS